MVFRRRMGLHPVNSIKHVIDTSGGTVGATESSNVLAFGVANPDVGTTPSQVAFGASVKNIFISVFVLGPTGGSSGLVDWYIWKNPGSSIILSDRPVPGNVGISKNRKWVFHEEKGLAATQDGTPMVFKGVIKVPEKMRRFGEDDKIEIVLLTETGFDSQFCIKAIYKEFR